MKKMLLVWLILSFLSGFSALSGAEGGLMADMVLLNGKIFTVNAEQPWAQAVAIRDGRFVAVGKDEEIKELIGKETQVIDLQGKLALPGFNDAHLHFTNGGLYLLGIDLRPARSEKEFTQILKEYI